MIPPGIPGKLAQQAMILVQVVTAMCEYQVGSGFLLQAFEYILDLCTAVWEISVPELMNNNNFAMDILEKIIRTVPGFKASLAQRAEDNPGYLNVRILMDQAEDRPATTDFDIVAVCAQKKHMERLLIRLMKL